MDPQLIDTQFAIYGTFNPTVSAKGEVEVPSSTSTSLVDGRVSQCGDDANSYTTSAAMDKEDEDDKEESLTPFISLSLLILGTWRRRRRSPSNEAGSGDDDDINFLSLEEFDSEKEPYARTWLSIAIDIVTLLYLSLVTSMLIADGYVYLHELWGKSRQLLFMISYLTYLLQVIIIPVYALFVRTRALLLSPKKILRCPLDPRFVRRRLRVIRASPHQAAIKTRFALLFMSWPTAHALLRGVESLVVEHHCQMRFFIFSDVAAVVGFVCYGFFWYIVLVNRISLHLQMNHALRIIQRSSYTLNVDAARRNIRRIHHDYLAMRELMGVWMAYTMVTATWGIMSRLSWDYSISTEDESAAESRARIYLEAVIWSEKTMFLVYPCIALGGMNLEYLWQRFRYVLERMRTYQHRSFWTMIQLHTLYINNIGSPELKWTIVFALVGPYLAIQSHWQEEQNVKFWNGPFNCSTNFNGTA
ncbi:uncharacterized protein [Diadema setosum]|uniref:uncharacterized protein n=1 Tax=Diadema setosum TaxID=31175 RepID=UPI003B3A893F